MVNAKLNTFFFVTVTKVISFTPVAPEIMLIILLNFEPF
jgi:hypothetical protein